MAITLMTVQLRNNLRQFYNFSEVYHDFAQRYVRSQETQTNSRHAREKKAKTPAAIQLAANDI